MNVEQLIKQYPQMKRDVLVLEFQLSRFEGITSDDIIESMYYSHPEGERIQTSNRSDKTAKVAINYQKVAERLNDDYFDYLFQKHEELKLEIDFFEFSLCGLNGFLSEVMLDMIINCMSWECLASKYHVTKQMISKYRKKAVQELTAIYEARDKQTETYILS
ncbi:MAG: hypothetical protein RR593_10510 [Hungatella sp.]